MGAAIEVSMKVTTGGAITGRIEASISIAIRVTVGGAKRVARRVTMRMRPKSQQRLNNTKHV